MTDDMNLDKQTIGESDLWVGGWRTPILVIVSVLAWFLVIYWMIGDRHVDWDYGVVPYVPGQSSMSTHQVPRGQAPNQVELPKKVEKNGD